MKYRGTEKGEIIYCTFDDMSSDFIAGAESRQKEIDFLRRENELLGNNLKQADKMDKANCQEIELVMKERDELRKAFFELAPSLPKWAWNKRLEDVFQKYEKKRDELDR
jgi:hypothetical protein